MHWATPAAPYIGCHFRDISEPTLGCPHSLLTLRLLRYKNHLEWDLRTGHADAKLAFCLLDLPLSHGILSALGRGAGTLVNHRAMAPISLLTSPGQQWKSLCLLSMQIKIIAANNEKLNGCHWAKPKCYTVASLASQGFLSWATFFSNHLYLSKRYSYCTWVFWIIE